MTFRPSLNRIEVKPTGSKTLIETGKESFVESGEIVSINGPIDLNIGDIVYFESYGCVKTAPDSTGKIHYIINLTQDIIIGLERNEEK